MADDQILVDRATFLRLVDQYLINKIRFLHSYASLPNTSIDSHLRAQESMMFLENLRNEFKSGETGGDYAIALTKLQSTFGPQT